MVIKFIIVPLAMLNIVYWSFALVYYALGDKLEKNRIHNKKIDWAFYRKTMKYCAWQILLVYIPITIISCPIYQMRGISTSWEDFINGSIYEYILQFIAIIVITDVIFFHMHYFSH